MKKDQVLQEIKAIRADISKIKERLDITIKTLPPPAGSSNPYGHKKCFSHKLIGGFQNPEVRDMVISLHKQGLNFKKIETAIKERWPDNPEKHKSKSAIHRFCVAARNGRLREYGL